MNLQDIEQALKNPFENNPIENNILPYESLFSSEAKETEFPPSCNTLVTEINEQ